MFQRLVGTLVCLRISWYPHLYMASNKITNRLVLLPNPPMAATGLNEMIAGRSMLTWCPGIGVSRQILSKSYLEDHPRTDGYVVNNHGDRKSPNWGYSPSKWPNFIAYKWGLDPNHLHPLGAHPPSSDSKLWRSSELHPFLVCLVISPHTWNPESYTLEVYTPWN